MRKETESQYDDNRFAREIGRPYFLPFFIVLIIALFGELQVFVATLDFESFQNGNFIFSHFGLFLSLSILTMAGVVWAVKNGVSENQRRVALAFLSLAVMLIVFFGPSIGEPSATPVFRIPIESVQSLGHDLFTAVQERSVLLQ